MIKNVSKRFLAVLLSLLVLISVVPATVFATNHNSEHDELEHYFDDSSLIWDVLLDMNNILLRYLGSTDMTEDEIIDIVIEMDFDTMLEAIEDIDALENSIMELPELEANALLNTESATTLGYLESTLTLATTPTFFASKTNSVLNGQVSVTDSEGNGTVSNGTVTITAKGGLLSKKTNNVTIANETDNHVTLKFDYNASKAYTFKIAGATASASGTYSALLGPGESVAIVITSNSGFSNTTATLKLSNFSLTQASTSSKVTVNYDADLGSVIAGGESVASGTQLDVSLAEGIVLNANVNNSTFLAWVNADTNEVISRAASFTFVPAEDITVKAVFVNANSEPHFWGGVASQKSESSGFLGLSQRYFYQVDSVTHLYENLTDATNLAPSTKSKTLVLANDATLPAGDYTIPAGITLLVPFDDAFTMYTTEAQSVDAKSHKAPTAYRTLTLAEGVNLTVNGSVSLSAKHGNTNGARVNGGSPHDKVAFVKMNDGSAITVNNGGALYAYGFVTGSGSITANSGATIYENFQIMDFRGGDQATKMQNGVFPVSAYYVQNIEVPLTLKSGATEYSYTSVNMTNSTFGTSVAFISKSNAMFNLTSGEVTKRYDGTSDRLVIKAKGDMLMSPINMDMGTASINSAEYFLPVNGNITVEVTSGSMTLSQNLAMLPGSEIIVREGVTCKLSNGVKVIVYDKDDWGNYVGAGNKYFIPVTNAPGRTYTRTDADIVDAKVLMDGYMDASLGYLYTTANGANVYSTGTGKINMLAGTDTKTYQFTQATEGGTYTEIPITPAKLLNYDGSYVTTVTGTYDYIADLGIWCNHADKVIQPAKDATCTETGLTEGSYCSTCGRIFATQEITDSKGHTEVTDSAKDATCTETGLTEGSHCSACGHIFVAQEIIPVTGHTVVIDEAKDATCTETGLTEGSHCSVCNAVIKAQQVVPLKGHTPGDDATCMDAQTCSVCGETLKAALGHDYAAQVISPTCTDKGYTVHTCTRCGDNYTDSEIPAAGHKLGAGASCTESGVCTVCGTVLESALGHNYDSVVTDATCTTDGYTTHTCSRCGDTYKDDFVDALGHDVVIDEAKDATCTETGLTEGSHCSVCKEVLVIQNVVPASGHDVVVIEGTAATCTEDGITEGKYCSVCNEVLVKQEVITAKGHSIVIDVQKAATCTEDGLTEGKHCSTCNEVILKQELIPAKGHDMKDATCVMPIHCANGCGLTEGAPLGHNVVVDEEYPAFCDEPGLTAGSHCTVCNEAIIPQEVIPALGHNLIYYDAKKPTYTGVGWEAYEDCTRCAHTTYVEIPKLKTPTISDYNTFIENLALLEELAFAYAQEIPGTDPLELVIKYIRTGVDRYNSGSWGIMAGYENANFAEYVAKIEDEYNSIDGIDFMIAVSSLKNISHFTLPNGDNVDFGHMFGTMDITYHNDFGENHADVAGWAGDIVDLMSVSDQFGVTATDIDGMVAEIAEKYLLKNNFPDDTKEGSFGLEDMYGDLDGFYIMNTLESMSYEQGDLSALFVNYFTEDLTNQIRTSYFISNRMNGISLRESLRNEVYYAYTGNKVITTLENTREFESKNLGDLRKACCYAFADYICKLGGDYVEVTNNPYFTVFSSNTSVLAPGITQNIKYATSADNKQMVYYLATADITRDDVNVYANYHDNNPSGGWAMQRVLDQANAAQAKYGDPASEHYIENYNVIASINGSGYNMSTGEPSGLLVMNGVEYHSINGHGYFAIMKDGTAMIGTQEDYAKYKSEIAEGIAGFGTTLIKDGKIAVTATSNYYSDRASRTAVGITATGKVVFMVLDGRQEPFSCGGSMIEIAQIMFEAGCVNAVNLDGGGSTTFVAKQEGAEALEVVNSPSDGAPRSVSTSLMMVSTAVSSTAFDHAVIESGFDYLTVGSSITMTADGVSATGNAAELPEGTEWSVSDERFATITEDGVLTARRNGSVTVELMLDGEVIGSKDVHIVIPENLYFTRENINAVYGEKVELPVVAVYQNKPVCINDSDIEFVLSNSSAGSMDGFFFTGSVNSKVKKLVATATLTADTEKSASINISLFNQGEISFDFDQATGGDRLLAWYREVTNSITDDNSVYEAVDINKDMVTSYVFAIDMTQIPIPERLSDLTTMLPGADMEGASAWSFLCQLAERVSVLTEIRPVIYFDKDVDVDYSELNVINEYFEFVGTEFNEEENSLTLILNWKDQTSAIDLDSANPLCIVNGIKLTPKADADWGTNNHLQIATTGEISYKIYLRANALYSFTLKPENQEIYTLYPFINPNNPSEKGGYFEDVYTNFNDSYTLSKTYKDGWVIENGGFAYYENGSKLTGVHEIDGQYYDFGENGINIGQSLFSGLIYDETGTRGIQAGKIVTGWRQFNDVYYYFDTDTTYALKDGRYLIDNFYYVFDEDGVNTMGQWVRVLYNGEIQTKYINTGKYVVKRFAEINGKTYWFDKNGFLVTGDQVLKVGVGARPSIYLIDENGVVEGKLDHTGSYTCADGIAYGVINGELVKSGFHFFDTGVYFCNNNYDGILSTGKTYVDGPYATEEYPEGWYYFDETGRMYDNEFAEVDGNIYYFENGVPARTGVFEIDGEMYYSIWNGVVQTGKVYITVSGGADALSGAGFYYFDETGKLYDEEFATFDGTIYYMVDGRPTNVAGLKEIDGEIYFVTRNGITKTGKVNVTAEYTNGILPAGTYYFNETGALADDEFITMDGKQYYIKNGQLYGVGVFEVGDDLYCAEWNNVIRIGKIYITESSGNGIVTAGWYYTDETGRFYDHETLTVDGTVYYMVNGKPETVNGVRNMNGNLYCFNWNGAVRIGKIYVTEDSSNGIVNAGWYYTDETGRFYNDEFVTIDGNVYFMMKGQPEKINGVREIHGDLYCFEWNGVLRVGNIFVTESSSNGIVESAWYYTDETGRFYNKEFLEIDGVLYYMEKGRTHNVSGVIEVNDRLYCLEWNGKVRSGKIYITADSGKGYLTPGWYYTNEDGSLLHNEFMTLDGNLYFMQNGTIAKLGVFEFEGKLYFADKSNGKLAKNGRFYVTVYGSNEEIIWGYHDFDENGVMLT